MKTKLILFILLLAGFTLAQEPQVKIPLIITDSVDQDTLYFGLDPAATNGIDPALGEEELPPLPPTGVFATRFTSNSFADLGQGSAQDYRAGSSSGTYQHKHKLTIQLGTGTDRIIKYDLPSGVTLILKDPITSGSLLNVELTGSGEYLLEFDLQTVDMTADYNIDLLLTPYDLNADDTTPGQIDLNWSDDNTNETGFIIERQNPVTRAYSEIGRTGANETTYTDNSGEQTKTYQYRVKAYNASGESLPSNEVAATVGIVPITAPSNLAAEAQVFGEVELTWNDNSNNEDKFIIERSLATLRAFQVIDSVNSNITSYNDNTVEENTTYLYRVKAKNNYTESDYSNEVEVTSLIEPIDAPANLTIDATTPGELNLSWTDNSDNETGFVIERESPELRAFVQIDTTNANVTSFKDENVIQNETYNYRVKAVNDLTESDYSNIATAIVIPIPIAAPTQLSASATVYGQIDLEWNDNADNETGYYILREIVDGSRVITKYDSVAANTTTYSDTDVDDGLTYNYAVQAYNEFTISDVSNQSEATALVKPIEAPTNLTATSNETGGIDLTWTDNSDNETGFYIEREDPALRTFAVIDSVAENTTTYSDDELEEGKTYKYRVRGFNNQTVSNYSNEASATTVMGAPSDLTVTAENEGSLFLNWKDNSSTEDGFIIERQAAIERAFEVIDTVAEGIVEYEDNTVNENTTYEYRVKAYNQFTETTYSNTASAVALIYSPTNLAVENLDINKVKLTWEDKSMVEEAYKVERSDNDSSNYTEVGQTNSNIIEFIDSSVTEGNKYFYRVSAAAGGNFSSYSNEVNIITTIAAPSNLTGVANNNGSVDLNWEDNSSNEAGYKIQREDAVTRTLEEIAEVGPDVTSYVDNATEEATTYNYRVLAFTDLAVSEGSNTAEVTTVPIASPDSALAEPTEQGNVNLSWNDNSNVEDGYDIERLTGSPLRGVEYELIGSVPANTDSYTDTTTAEGTEYKYRVKAFNESNESGEAETNSVQTVPVAAPSELNYEVSLNSESPLTWNVKLKWKDNSEVETGIMLEKQIEGNSTREFTPLSDLPPNTMTFNDSSLATKQTIQYRVHAYSPDTTSSFAYTESIRLNFQPEFVDVPDVTFNEDNSYTLPLIPHVNDLDDDSTQFTFSANVLSSSAASSSNSEVETNSKGNSSSSSDLDVTITELNEAKFTGAKDAYGNFNVELKVTDSDGAVGLDTIKVTINPVNDAPVISNIPNINLDEDSETSIDLDDYVGDVDNNNSQLDWTVSIQTLTNISHGEEETQSSKIGGRLLFSESKQLSELSKFITKKKGDKLIIQSQSDIDDSLTISIDPSTHVATITATNNFNTTGIPVVFTATDPGGLSDSDESTIIVNSINDAPVLSFPAIIALYNKLDTTLAIDGFVSDVETPFENLIIEFSSSNDSLTISLNGNLMTVTVLASITGNVDVSVTVTDEDGLSADTTIAIDVIPNSVNSLDGIPKTYVLENNYPNPFNPATVIRFGIPYNSKVKLEVFNILGQKVQTLVNENLSAGYYEMNFNAIRYASGVYIYTIYAESTTNSDKFSSIKKMMLVK